MKNLIRIIFLLIFIPFSVYSIEIKSDKAIVVNLDDNLILYEKNANEKTSIASLTKIITAITILDNVDDVNKKITITSAMLEGLDGYSKVGLKVGDRLSITELLYALMLPSAADAANALAIGTCGSIEKFANLMNKEIEKIGVNNSKFSNPIGMDDSNNYSTAYDIYIILKYAIENNLFNRIFESNKYYLAPLGITIEKTSYVSARNNNIDFSSIKGSKTGFTIDAGRCLAATVDVNDINFIIVNLNANSDSLDYITDTIKLSEYYKKNYDYVNLYKKNDLLFKIKIKNTTLNNQKEYNVLAEENIVLYINKNIEKDDIDISFDGVKEITSNIKKGQKLGTLKLEYNGEEIYSKEVFLESKILFINYKLCVGVLIILLTSCVIFKKKRKKKRKKK